MDFDDCELEYLRFRLSGAKEMLSKAEENKDLIGVIGFQSMLSEIDQAIAKKLSLPCSHLDRNSLLSILRETQDDLEAAHLVENKTSWDIWDTKVYEQIIKHYERAIDERIKHCGEF